jgi:hypothetical protein
MVAARPLLVRPRPDFVLAYIPTMYERAKSHSDEITNRRVRSSKLRSAAVCGPWAGFWEKALSRGDEPSSSARTDTMKMIVYRRIRVVGLGG